MRADRLISILLLLQSHGRMTAVDLAERLEASERTIRRDLESLGAAGVPVFAMRGRGGGWELMGGHRTDLSGLTADEAQALFLVAGPQAVAGLGIEPGVRSALRKLLAALPAPLRAEAAAARSAVLVDPMGWGRNEEPAPYLDALRRAAVAGVQVELSYAKRGDAPTVRRVHPHGLVSKAGTWYLLAGTDSGMRTFRVSRVHGVVTTGQPVERPAGFDLETEWQNVRERVPRTYAPLRVELRVHQSVERDLTQLLTGWATLEREGDDDGGAEWGRFVAHLPNARVAAAELARYGERVGVVAPGEVRAELASLGAQLVASYAVSAGRGGRDSSAATPSRATRRPRRAGQGRSG